MGYVGGLRKELGYRATSELALEAMRKKRVARAIGKGR